MILKSFDLFVTISFKKITFVDQKIWYFFFHLLYIKNVKHLKAINIIEANC